MEILSRIKRLVVAGRVRFTEKARAEMEADDLAPYNVFESLLNAQMIEKTLRSRDQSRRSKEKLYVIKSFDYSGTLIYTKGKIHPEAGKEIFYVLISSKIATLE